VHVVPPMPVNLLVILATPGAIVLSQRLPGLWLVAIGVGLLLAALGVMSRAAAREIEPGGRVGLGEAQRIAAVMAYAAALAVGGLALFISIASVAASMVLLGIAAIWVVLWWPPVLRTSRVANTVMIEREPAIVFRFLGDSRNTPLWHSAYESVEKLTPGPIGPGTRFLAQIKIPSSSVPSKISAPTEGIEEIVDYEPNRRIAARAILSSSSNPNLAVTTIESVAGGSLVSYNQAQVNEYSVAVIGGILQGLRYDKRNRTRRAAVWARAKEVLESGIEPTS
jgi:hypothetical protein